MDFILPVGLGLVGVLFVLIMSAEIFYLFYWRKRRLDGPRLNNVTVAPVNEGEQVEVRNQSRAAVVIDVTCAEYQISTLQQDLVEKLFPTLSSASHEAAHHTMVGPPRMLFTIKEETKEELEGLVDMDCKGVAAVGPRVGGVPSARAWLTFLSLPGNVPMGYSRSSSSTGTSGKISPSSPPGGTYDHSPSPPASPPVRKPLFLHLASSPTHKQAECVVKTMPHLRSCTFEDYDDDDSCSLSPQSSSPDRSPNFYSTPTPFFDPITFMGQANIQVPLPSSKGSSFNRRLKGNDFSPLSSPSDDETPYASPLLTFQSRARGGETEEEEYEASTSPAATEGHQIFTEDEKLPPPTREGVLLPIVLPTSFSFQAARLKAMSVQDTPPMVLSSDSGGMMHHGPDMLSMNRPDFQKFS